MFENEMLAVLCTEWCKYDELKLTKVSRPKLEMGQARVRVEFAGVSFATTLVVAGKYQRKPPLPFIPGTEVAGEVIEVAGDVSRIKPGDIVFGAIDWGGYAEEVTAAATNFHILPDGLAMDQAVALAISYPTSYGALVWRADLKKGETLLVLGAAGGVGLAAVEIGRLLGARVLGVVSSQEKKNVIEWYGGETINIYDLKTQIMASTNGKGADVVFDPVGGENSNQALSCLRPGGRLLSIGYASNTIPKVGYNILLVKNISVMGFNYGEYVGWGPVDRRLIHLDHVDTAQQHLLKWWRTKKVKPRIHARFKLCDFRKAMAEVVRRKAIGRVLLEIAK